ncbi:MAG: hypothetical protein L6Q76_06310 [Polyangiaceae bacterium]|nr:hypothetical protein [Polyangiaceae bacterium]
MMKQLMSMVGMSSKRSGLFGLFSRKARFPFLPVLPVGGVLPVAAYLAWKNRDRIRGLYDRIAHRHDEPAAAAA